MSLALELVARLVSRNYRISPKAVGDLSAAMAATLNALGDQILPADNP